jgi:hypothetical protein
MISRIWVKMMKQREKSRRGKKGRQENGEKFKASHTVTAAYRAEAS